jgi:hypothetical protein
MIKRTIEISGKGNDLSIDLGSLVIRKDGEPLGRIPLEDIGLRPPTRWISVTPATTSGRARSTTSSAPSR